MDYHHYHRQHRRHMSLCATAEIVMILCFHGIALFSLGAGIAAGLTALLIYIVVTIWLLRQPALPDPQYEELEGKHL